MELFDVEVSDKPASVGTPDNVVIPQRTLAKRDRAG